jgi:hypothetical protein
MLVLFPPPKYEMPNDFFFEFTGVLQAVLVVPIGVYLFRAISSSVKRSAQ